MYSLYKYMFVEMTNVLELKEKVDLIKSLTNYKPTKYIPTTYPD